MNPTNMKEGNYMFIEPVLEIKKSISNVLQSSYTSKEISDFCDISFTTISELRTGKRDLNKINFSFCQSLYKFAVSHNINQEYINTEKKKGNHKYIPIDMDIKKIIVSFEPLDLFAYGYLNSKSLSNYLFVKPNTLSKLDISKSLFIDTQNNLYDTYTLGHFFNCRYGGSGPNNFVDFLSKYSKLQESDLKSTIFNNSVVEYNLETDELKSFPSKISGTPITFYSLNNKLILVLNKYGYNFREENPGLDHAITDILYILDLLSEKYGYNNNIQQVKYINNHDTDETSIYRLTPKNLHRQNNDAHIIFEFEQFEIWLPYEIHQERGNIFSNPDFQKLITGLNIQKPLNDKFFSTTVKMVSKIEPLSILF